MARIHPRLVALAGLLVPILGVLVPRSLAVTLVVVALLVVAFYRKEVGAWPSLPGLPLVLVGSLLAWSALSAFWNFSPSETWEATAKLAVLSASGLAFAAIAAGLWEEERALARKAFGIGFLASIALLAGDEWTRGFLTRVLRGATDLPPFDDLAFLNMAASLVSVILWPALMFPAGRWRWALLALPVVVGLLIDPLESLAAQTALAAGVAVFLAALYRERLTFRLLRAAVFALMVFAPAWPHLLPTPAAALSADPGLSFSIAHRLAIWQFAAHRIAEKPLTGWGLESSRHFQERYGEPFPVQYRAANVEIQKEAALAYFKSQILPLHPHNGFLQVWLELGAIGALAFLALLLRVLTAAERLAAPPFGRAAMAALFATGLVIFLTAFGAWQSWWQGALWLMAGMAVAVCGRGEEGRPAAGP